MLPDTISLLEETRTIATKLGERNLTRQQFAIVREMCANNCRVVSFKTLANVLWGDRGGPKNESVVVRTQISSLRKIVAPLGLQIKNIRSDGYYFETLELKTTQSEQKTAERRSQ